MPLYEYSCEECPHKATHLRKMEDRDAPITCGECGSEMIRVVALTGDPRFNGDGFTPKFHS
jgi:putative FmdB family regulatory protein